MKGAALVAIAASIGNLLQGWDNAVIAGNSSSFFLLSFSFFFSHRFETLIVRMPNFIIDNLCTLGLYIFL